MTNVSQDWASRMLQIGWFSLFRIIADWISLGLLDNTRNEFITLSSEIFYWLNNKSMTRGGGKKRNNNEKNRLLQPEKQKENWFSLLISTCEREGQLLSHWGFFSLHFTPRSLDAWEVKLGTKMWWCEELSCQQPVQLKTAQDPKQPEREPSTGVSWEQTRAWKSWFPQREREGLKINRKQESKEL